MRLGDIIVSEARQALRNIVRSPAVAITIFVTVGFGVAATTAVFSIVNGALLRPLSYPDSGRIAVANAVLRGEAFPISYSEFLDWKSQNSSFDKLAAVEASTEVNVTGRSEPQRVTATRVTAEFFDVFGGAPLLGRTLQSFGDKTIAEPAGIAISTRLWQRAFASDKNVIGKAVEVDGAPHTVMAVLPPSFSYPPGADLWMLAGANQPTNRRMRGFHVVGKFRHDLALSGVAADLRLIAHRLEMEYPDSNRGFGVRVELLRDRLLGDSRSDLLLLLSSICLLLLVACLNVGSILLSRAVARKKETAIRLALGASRTRIAYSAFAESLIFGFGAAIIGLVGGLLGARILASVVFKNLPSAIVTAPDERVLCFGVAIAFLSAVLFGLAPTLRLLRMEETWGMRGLSHSASRMRHDRSRSLLIVSEIAVTLVLLSSSTSVFRSFLQNRSGDFGFDMHNLISFGVSLPTTNGEIRDGKYWDILGALSATPGIKGAAATSAAPLRGRTPTSSFAVGGEGPVPPDRRKLADLSCVTAGYFRLMHIPLLAGRDFMPTDAGEGKPPTVIVNRTLLRRFSLADGRQPHIPSSPLVLPGIGAATIVGVVGDIAREVTTQMRSPEIYLNCRQFPTPSMTFVVRTNGDVPQLASIIRERVHSIDASLPVFRFATFFQDLDSAISDQRLQSVLLIAFATSSLVLASLGVYALVTYLVGLRRHEVAIRISVGAHRLDILGLVLKEGLTLGGLGILVGIFLSLAIGQVISGTLYRATATSLPVMIASGLLLLVAVLLATLVPAYQTTRIDPTQLLRAE